MSDKKISEKEELWLLCFDDSLDTARSFLEIKDIETVTEREGDTLSAMASLVPVRCDSGELGFYAYGVCTRPEHRGRGAFRRIMRLCEERALSVGAAFVCLIAADERLRDTYRRMGYTVSVSLAHRASTNDTHISCLSQEFLSFAEPDGALPDDSQFGLLKPLANINTNVGFAFSSHMGEI